MQKSSLEEALRGADSGLSMASVHGFVSGWLSSGTAWAQSNQVVEEHFDSQSSALKAVLESLAAETFDDLRDEALGFKLRLGEEERSINLRRQALSDWCEGFLEGFGLTGRYQQHELHEEVQELIEDFAKISQVEEEIPEDDDNEADLTEITEYVRMGALFIYTECASKQVH